MKKITSLTAMVSFLVLVVNSVVLYIVPYGVLAENNGKLSIPLLACSFW